MDYNFITALKCLTLTIALFYFIVHLIGIILYMRDKKVMYNVNFSIELIALSMYALLQGFNN